MIWGNIQFDEISAAFLLLLVFPLLWGFYLLYRFRQERMAAFADQSLLDVIVEKRTPTAFWTKSCLFCLVWVCAAIALMQPKGNERYVTSPEHQRDVVHKTLQQKATLRKKLHEVIILLDASASMSISDAQGGKTREAVAKEIADHVISELRGENVSLYAFTSATMQIVPSTMDYLFTRLMLRQVGINEGETTGTNIKQSLDTVRRLYFSGVSPTTKTIILLTDGGDTHLEGASEGQRREIIDDIVKPVADAQAKNLRVLVVGIGSREGKEIPGITFHGHSVLSALEEPLLRRLSVVGRGEFLIANEMTPFQVSQQLSKRIAQEEVFMDASTEIPLTEIAGNTRVYDLYFQIPLGIAMFALAGCLLIPDTRKRSSLGKVAGGVMLLLLHDPAYAIQSNDTAYAQVMQANMYFDAEDYSRAFSEYETTFDDRLNGWEQAVLLYNMGAALLAQGRWEDALYSFERAADKGDALPLLNQRLAANTALASLMFFRTRCEEIKNNPQATHEEYFEMMVFFRKVKADIEAALSAWCALFADEGATQCPLSITLNEIQAEAKRVYAELLKTYQQDPRLHAPKDATISTIVTGTPLEQAVQQLSKDYTNVLTSEPMQQTALQQLSKEQEAAKSVFDGSPYQEEYHSMQQYLTKGADALIANQPDMARVFVLAAQFLLNDIADQLLPSIKHEADSILESVIRKERFVLILTQSGLAAGDIQELLPIIQQVVLARADRFTPALLVEERAAYSANKEDSCQCHPWNDVVPLFGEGYSAARRALEFPKQSVTPSLQEALRAWKEALEKMRAPKKQMTPHQNVKEKEAVPQPIQRGIRANDAIRLVQEMELDDQSKVDRKLQGSSGDDRPW